VKNRKERKSHYLFPDYSVVMKLKFPSFVKRINGISTPIFGVSWNPGKPERDIARQVISYLEDRRVLYAPSERELPSHCVDSVLQMRQFLTSRI
jgi:hypothetical protein